MDNSTHTVIDGSAIFDGGMDSYMNPRYLPQNKVALAENLTFRGGIAQTRPGSRTIFSLPCGWLQFCTLFQPTGLVPYLVVGVAGLVYASAFPFNYYEQVQGINLLPNAKFVAHAECVQTTTYTAMGQLQPLATPRAILMLQDGFSRAAFWDGNSAGHLNPGPSNVLDSTGNPVVTPDTYGTPMGLIMSWVGNRLWVSRGAQVFASDIGNPTVFSEQTYISNLNGFVMPEPVTGMVQPFYGSPLIVFGANSQTFLQAEIQDRTTWGTQTSPPFQTSYIGIGCLSHRSIVKQFGLVWWYGQGGMINLNNATQNLIDSFAPYVDSEMMVSKANISPDKSLIAGTAFEHYLLLSVPSGDTLNRHTWSLDQDTNGTIWDGYWTGWRPVEWASGVVAGEPRCFFVSQDYDGVNRLWEAFTPDRTDNGQPITSLLQTKMYSFAGAISPISGAAATSPDEVKDYQFCQFQVQETLDVVDVWGGFSSLRGAFQNNLTLRIEPNVGPLGIKPDVQAMNFQGFKPQTRVIRTAEVPKKSTDCNPCGVEDIAPYYRDRAFSQMLIWSGRMGITGLRLFAQAGAYPTVDGKCTPDETAPHVLAEQGCGSKENDIVTAMPFTTYTATGQATLSCVDGCSSEVTGTYIATSIISQLDANKKAEGGAVLVAQSQLQCL